MYEIHCRLTGDRAEALDDDAALAAAAQLVRDAFDGMPVQGRDKAARESLYIVRDGAYQGILTELARLGHGSLVEFERAELVALGDRGSRAARAARGNL